MAKRKQKFDPKKTNLTEEIVKEFDTLVSGGYNNVALLSCFAIGVPTSVICGIHRDMDTGETTISPLYLRVCDTELAKLLVNHDGIPAANLTWNESPQAASISGIELLEKYIQEMRTKLDLPPAAFPIAPAKQSLEARLHKDPGKCPFCGSDDLLVKNKDGEKQLKLKMQCHKCSSTWVEHYHFVSASDFESD